MRKKSKTLFLLLSLSVFIFSLELGAGIEADDTPLPRGEVFDLADIAPGSTIERALVDGRMDMITFLNVYSERYDKYEMQILIEFEEIPPISVEVLTPREPLKPNCTDLAKAIDKFMTLTDSKDVWLEKKVRDEIITLQELVNKCTDENELDKKNKAIVQNIINKSKKTFKINQRLNKGEKLTIKLSRDNIVWTFVFKYPSGKWLIYYGLCLVSQRLSKYDHYFVSESEDPAQNAFLLIQEPKPDYLDLEYIPTVFFTWMPTHRMSKSINHGITGGLGTDMKSPTFYIGYGIVFNYNIGINLGVIFHKQYQLKPQYSEMGTDPKTVNGILSFDDLHRSVYRPNVSIGISFRFGSNPFTEME